MSGRLLIIGQEDWSGQTSVGRLLSREQNWRVERSSWAGVTLDALRHSTVDVVVAMALSEMDRAARFFRWLRGNTYRLIRNLPDDVWLHTMEHTENGTITMDDWLHTYEDHIPAHVRQMREIYQEWKAAQPV